MARDPGSADLPRIRAVRLWPLRVSALRLGFTGAPASDPATEGNRQMNARTTRSDGSRKRLAANHNETIVVDRPERSRKRLAANHNETIVVER